MVPVAHGLKRGIMLSIISAALLAACTEPTSPHGPTSGPRPVPKPSPAPKRAPCKLGGSDALAWQLTNPALHHEIEGYASAPSVNRGGSIALFVSTADSTYALDLYRMGWYDGAGAEQMIPRVMRHGERQPLPVEDAATGLIECPWRDPYVLAIPSSWPSGVYLAKLTGASGHDSYIIFVVRDDARRSDFLVQVSLSTYEAYNDWGGKSLYAFNSIGGSTGVARAVSFDRPFVASTAGDAACGAGAGEFLTNLQPATSHAGWEYNMVRFLEREGYDVAYTTDVDVHEHPELLRQHKTFLVVGHDEYWSGAQRRGVVAARDAGVNLGFFAANTSYWQMRYAPSTLTGTPDRTMVAYKETAFRLDPLAVHGSLAQHDEVTARFRDLGMPEAQLVGIMYGYYPVDGDIVIDDDTTWVTAGTGLTRGTHLSGLLGYEVDKIVASSPPNIERIGHSYVPNKKGYSDMTLYAAPSGALVFATGSMQWTWGLDDYNAPGLRPSRLSAAAQQITRNVLNRFRRGR